MWSDIQIAKQHGISLINLATEPIVTKELAQKCFGIMLDSTVSGSPTRYNMLSQHADVFGGDNGYLYKKDQIIKDIQAFRAHYLSV